MAEVVVGLVEPVFAWGVEDVEVDGVFEGPGFVGHMRGDAQNFSGAHVPLHHHHNEQVTYILEGALKFAIDGQEIVVRAGEVLCIPPHMPHEAWALEDTVDLDVFDPPREDWLNKTDDYLRHGR